jgi:16S rRNA (guanine966-N2)-methyltransferase
LGTLRIIGGELRGRRLRVPEGTSVRPTADRVREALFNILGDTVFGARVLDPFAGSGALGFEALSRGAAEVTFIERDRAVLAVLRENAEALGVESRIRVLSGAAERVLAGTAAGGPWDLVLADPPYELSPEPWVEALRDSGGLAEGGRLLIERDARAPGVDRIRDLSLYRSATYGGTRLDFYAA